MSKSLTAAFNLVIRTMDSEYLKHKADEAEKKRKERERSSAKPPGRGGL